MVPSAAGVLGSRPQVFWAPHDEDTRGALDLSMPSGYCSSFTLAVHFKVRVECRQLKGQDMVNTYERDGKTARGDERRRTHKSEDRSLISPGLLAAGPCGAWSNSTTSTSTSSAMFVLEPKWLITY